MSEVNADGTYAAEEGGVGKGQGSRGFEDGDGYYPNDRKNILRSGNGMPPVPSWFIQPEERLPQQDMQLQMDQQIEQDQQLLEQLQLQQKQRDAKLRRNITSWLGRQTQQKMMDPMAARASLISDASHIKANQVDLDGENNQSKWPLPNRPPPAPTNDMFNVPSVVGDLEPAASRTKSLDPSALQSAAVPSSDAGGDVPPVPAIRPQSLDDNVAAPRRDPIEDLDAEAMKRITTVTVAQAVPITAARPETVEIESSRGSVQDTPKSS